MTGLDASSLVADVVVVWCCAVTHRLPGCAPSTQAWYAALPSQLAGLEDPQLRHTAYNKKFAWTVGRYTKASEVTTIRAGSGLPARATRRTQSENTPPNRIKSSTSPAHWCVRATPPKQHATRKLRRVCPPSGRGNITRATLHPNRSCTMTRQGNTAQALQAN
jgi:hypothetical protein